MAVVTSFRVDGGYLLPLHRSSVGPRTSQNVDWFFRSKRCSLPGVRRIIPAVVSSHTWCAAPVESQSGHSGLCRRLDICCPRRGPSVFHSLQKRQRSGHFPRLRWSLHCNDRAVGDAPLERKGRMEPNLGKSTSGAGESAATPRSGPSLTIVMARKSCALPVRQTSKP